MATIHTQFVCYLAGQLLVAWQMIKGRSCLLVENCMTSCRHSACVPAQRLCRMRTIVKEMFMTQQDVQHQDGEDDCYCLQHATRHLNSAKLSTHSQMSLPLSLSFGIYLHYQTNIHCPLIVILLTSSQSNTSTLISCQNGKQNQQALFKLTKLF
ncbi:hypothetical protein T12_7821 [Trichinella patagoniensis]|uniref:Uncharacterized protein n=1 Tax=Trichinella patagoniensis TaxID=990121 RepID=A0A0V0ZLE9_9BILA|nr:hypothetical protein T12_7821 [Trichinella patagoniensis]